MATIRETVEVDRPVTEVFDAIADFSRTEVWDPGVARATQVEGTIVGLGAAFDVVLDVPGLLLRPTYRYRITTYERPRRVVLETSSLVATGRDDVIVEELPDGGSRVLWEATFRLRGPAHVLDPLLAVGFRRVGRKAVAGLRSWLRAGGEARVDA